MKKCTLFCLIFLLLTTWTFPTQAASTSYEIEELNLSLNIPSTYDVFTLNMSDDDPLFSKYGMDKSDLLAQFSSDGIYLDALSDIGDEEIIITMTENSIGNFNELSDTALLDIASFLNEEYANFGFTITESDVYHHAQLTFLRFYYHDTANTTYGVQYYTAYDNQNIAFTLRSYTGSLSSTQDQTFLEVVNSIELNSYVPSPTPIETASFVYTDQEAGITFTVPANWKVKELLETTETLDTKFVPTVENGAAIMYGSNDIWSLMSASEKKGYSRADINNSFFTKSEIAEMYGTTSSNVSEMTYNGKNYYVLDTTTTTEVYETPLSITLTYAIRFENGWFYIFQFGGDSASDYYKDFEALLNSVEYNESSTDNDTSNTDHREVSTEPPITIEYDESKTNDSSSFVTISITIAVIICIIISIACFKKYPKLRKYIIYALNFVLFTIINILFGYIFGFRAGSILFYIVWWFSSKAICKALDKGKITGDNPSSDNLYQKDDWRNL